METLRGISASPGVVVGKALVYDPGTVHPPRHPIEPAQVAAEQERFRAALAMSRDQILTLTAGMESDPSLRDLASLFSAHVTILNDPFLVDGTLQTIAERLVNAEYALTLVMRDFGLRFRSVEDEIIRARLADFQDIAKRVIRNLMGHQHESLAEIEEPVIVVATDLAPSDTVQMNRACVLGFATDVGGPTSHTAIIARAFEIPAVVGLQQVTQMVNDGDLIEVDGDTGVVILDPDEATLEAYNRRRRAMADHGAEVAALRDLPATTIDGYRISLQANLEIPQEVEAALRHGAEGIGLYRTEFLYLRSSTLPSEEDHYAAYAAVAEAMAPRPVVIRTLDLGGDKFSSQLALPMEMNPFMGWRAIRMCLELRDLFRCQLRAVLRASAVGNVRVMYPMIASIEEVIQANAILDEVRLALDQENIPYDRDIPVGAMIEIPSSALTADSLAELVDFFSIGTNDLIQYTLAVDRVNPKLAHLYDPLHPGVLRLIHQTVTAGHRHGIEVSMCGEMAGDPAMTLLLLGLELDHLSMSPAAIPEVKRAVRSVHISQAVELARQALELPTSRQIRELLEQAVG